MSTSFQNYLHCTAHRHFITYGRNHAKMHDVKSNLTAVINQVMHYYYYKVFYFILLFLVCIDKCASLPNHRARSERNRGQHAGVCRPDPSGPEGPGRTGAGHRGEQRKTESWANGQIQELEQEIDVLKLRNIELAYLSHTEDHIHFLQVEHFY